MNTTNNFSVNNISLYIPRVFADISKEQIMHTFDLLDIGWVNHIDFIPKITPKGENYNSAYVHFDCWYCNISNQNIQNRLKNSLECRVVYDDPWYWIVLENKGNKKDYSVPRTRINLDGLKELPKVVASNVIAPKVVAPKVVEKLFLPRVLTKENGKTIVMKTRFGKKEEFEDFKEAMWEERCIVREERDN
jgi:hypothetical protein